MPNSSQSPALGNKCCAASQAQPSHNPGHQSQRGCQDGLPQSGNNSHCHTGPGTSPTASLPDPGFRVGKQDPASDGGSPSRHQLGRGSLFLSQQMANGLGLCTVTADDTRNCPATFRPPPQTHSSHDKWFQPSQPTNQLYRSGRRKQGTDRKSTVSGPQRSVI